MVGLVYYLGHDQVTRQAVGFFAGSDHVRKCFDDNKVHAQRIIDLFIDKIRSVQTYRVTLLVMLTLRRGSNAEEDLKLFLLNGEDAREATESDEDNTVPGPDDGRDRASVRRHVQTRLLHRMSKFFSSYLKVVN